MTLTRDSVLWWLGLASAVLTALANEIGLFPAEWYRYIHLAALLVGIVSGWMKTSPLPGENDAAKKPPSVVTRVLIPFIVLLALGTVACGPPKTVQTEPGKRAWYASQVLQRVGELQSIAIDLEAKQIMTTAQARYVVEYCVLTARTLKNAPEGWEKVALEGYRAFCAKLPVAVTTNPSLATAFAVLDALLVTLAGGGA